FRERRGFALLLALVTLGVAGMFLVAGFYAARLDDRANRLARRIAQLDGANAAALASLAAAWDSAARFAQPVGTSAELSVAPPDPGAETRARITRLSMFLYIAAVRSRDRTDTTIAAGAAGLLRVEAPEFPALAASLARGDVGPAARVQSFPADPAAARACGLAPPGGGAGGVFPGFAVPPGSMAPLPSVQTAVAGLDSTYRLFGPVPLDTLVGRSVRELPPVQGTPAPVGAVTVARGDLTLTWGPGRGILIVLGRLTVAGPVSFHGVVLALGGLEVTAPGVMVTGLVLAGAGAPMAIEAKGNGNIGLRFDPCLVADVAWHAGVVRPVAGWGWSPAQ
ncbi:MAG: hypothetical protein KGO03_13670, partial [Gemmatimonadota bacterium]|nr:hypothetical protein [Gemmatimonadota bacterium]